MHGVLAAHIAKLAQLKFFLHFLFITLRVVRDILANTALHLRHVVLNVSHIFQALINHLLTGAKGENRTPDLLLTMETFCH